MKRSITGVIALLLSCMLIACGGGGDGGNSGGNTNAPSGGGSGTPGDNPPNDPRPDDGTLPSAGARVEENHPVVTLTGDWTPSSSGYGWSGLPSSARQSSTPGATASFTFRGTSVTWIGGRSRSGGIALVRIDGGPAREVDLFARPFEARTPIITISGLSDARHTLTIEVTGRQNAQAEGAVVVVDAFDVQAPIVSHFQETDPNVAYSGVWTQDPSGNWSGGGVASLPDPPVGGAKYAEAAGDKLTFTFRGTSITWQGGRGPLGGIARVSVDGESPVEIDTYGTTQRYQQVLFSKQGLAEGTHTLTIEVTGRKNGASAGTRIFVDAFQVTTSGRRYQEDHPSMTYSGNWTRRNVNRVWSEGASSTTNVPGSMMTFSFTGTGVSWIGCVKESCGARARVYLDGALVTEVNNWRPVPVEGYQHEIYRVDGLTNGPHTLTIEALSTNSYIVVDAFDVRP